MKKVSIVLVVYLISLLVFFSTLFDVYQFLYSILLELDPTIKERYFRFLWLALSGAILSYPFSYLSYLILSEENWIQEKNFEDVDTAWETYMRKHLEGEY